MIRSTFISLGLHSFLLTLAYFGLPALKTKEPIELPIDIVEDTPISSKTSLKFGQAKEKKILVKNKKQIDENILTAEFKLIDARSLNRFRGIEKEPREGLRSGSIPNSFCLPFGNCINKDTNEFLDVLKLEEKFKEILKDIKDTNIVFTCGSGVTASVLAFALSLINDKYSPIIYDGSWSEYGKYPS